MHRRTLLACCRSDVPAATLLPRSERFRCAGYSPFTPPTPRNAHFIRCRFRSLRELRSLRPLASLQLSDSPIALMHLARFRFGSAVLPRHRDSLPIWFCSRSICGIVVCSTLHTSPRAATAFSLRVLMFNQAPTPNLATQQSCADDFTRSRIAFAASVCFAPADGFT